ncbi:MAG: 2-succinyl-5-enolpyruvyl-6-hydroxy-3-cyclohexene-1-carboxylic-acid synthase [Rhodocyclaceae bacterium]|nr:2-succinyl-5-enolpyruvyl-6-hydroxy-3-cyclohexene-1-carboxylic-acid synthase [Rhodocyclaceae bacterium]
MSSSAFNRRWAGLALEALTRHGVRHVCIAPGSRSTPLTLAAARHAKLTCHTHFDERGLGYFALGLAKALRAPVAVIVTSGTAVANLYPAVIEAGLTGVPLVLLTADRPPEQIDCGANQAIRQAALFAPHACATLELPRPTPDIPAPWLLSAFDEAMYRQRQNGGAVQVNCPFAEPLYGDDSDEFSDWLAPVADWLTADTPWLNFVAPAAPPATDARWATLSRRKGVVVVGQLAPGAGQGIAAWAEVLGWPLLTDAQSGVAPSLPHADLWLGNPQAAACLAAAEVVVQLGARPISKRLNQWLETWPGADYWLVDPRPGRLDPHHRRGTRFCCSVGAWLEAHPAPANPPWAEELPALARLAQTQVRTHPGTALSEAGVAHRLAELLPPDGQLFLGNSLIVRLVDALAILPGNYPIHSNRGASGIDGLIATAAGLAQAGGRPTLAVVGDISALHDLNSLALLRTAPCVLLVVNNDGGAIFDLLPVPAAERERYYRMPHGMDFAHAAAQFGLAYSCPAGWDDLAAAVHRAWAANGALLVELRVGASDGAQALRALTQQVRDAVVG